jgi:hypothetical protein
VIVAIAFTDGSGRESLKADSGMVCSGLVRFVNGIGASKHLPLYEDERNEPFCAFTKGKCAAADITPTGSGVARIKAG